MDEKEVITCLVQALIEAQNALKAIKLYYAPENHFHNPEAFVGLAIQTYRVAEKGIDDSSRVLKDILSKLDGQKK